jgi:hypothetical protein
MTADQYIFIVRVLATQRLEGKPEVQVVCMDLATNYRALVRKHRNKPQQHLRAKARRFLDVPTAACCQVLRIRWCTEQPSAPQVGGDAQTDCERNRRRVAYEGSRVANFQRSSGHLSRIKLA